GCHFGRRRLARAAAQETHLRRRTADARHARRAHATTGFGGAEAVLHDAVLAGVVRQHRAAPAGHEYVDRLVKRRAEHIELAVDLDTQGLERALGRVAAATARR